MAKTLLTDLLGFDPVEEERKRFTASQRSFGNPYEGIGYGLGQLLGAGAKKLFNIEDPQTMKVSTVQSAMTAAGSQYNVGTSQYFEELARQLSSFPSAQATALQKAREARDKEDKEFRETSKFIADNPEALTVEANKLASRITQRAQAAGIDLSIDPNTGALKTPLTPEIQDALSNLPEAQRLNQLTQIGTKGAIKQFMELNKPETMPKLGFAEDDGRAVYRAGTEQFKLGPKGERVPYYGSFRKEAADIKLDTAAERFRALGQFREATKDVNTRMGALNRALVLNSRTGSAFSGASFKQEVSSIFGDAQKASTEIEALANTGALDERIAGRISSFLLGKSTETQKADRDATLKALRSLFKDDYERIATSYRTATGNKEEADRLFPSFEQQFAQVRGLPPKAPEKVTLTPAQKKDPRFAEGAVFSYPDGSTYKVIGGVLVKQPKEQQ